MRPTTALLRESVFSMLAPRLASARFLDLFAGSGIMGLEAVSRGAGFVLALEKDRVQARQIETQYRQLDIPDNQARVLALDVPEFLRRDNRQEPFDIVFLDPPYGFADLDACLADIEARGWVSPGGVIVAEQGSRDPERPGFDRRLYGDSALLIKTLDPV